MKIIKIINISSIIIINQRSINDEWILIYGYSPTCVFHVQPRWWEAKRKVASSCARCDRPAGFRNGDGEIAWV
jgi:hypothetical protein